MYCMYCGTKAEPGDLFCANCGAKLSAPQPIRLSPEPSAPQTETVSFRSAPYTAPRPVQQPRQEARPEEPKRKNAAVAFLLCFLFGIFGAHQFYAGRWIKGILYLFTFGLFGIGWLVDLILILAGRFKDRDGNYL